VGLADGAAILELPVYDPSRVAASAYSIYSMHLTRHPGPRAGGHCVIVPAERDRTRQIALRVQSNLSDGCAWQELTGATHIDYVAAHTYLPPEPDREPLVVAVQRVPGLHELRERDQVAVLKVDPGDFVCEREPA
jgi:hypothetical protein